MLGFDRGGSSGDPIGSGQDLFMTTEQLWANAGVIWPFSAAVSRRPKAGLHDSPVSGGPVHRRSEVVHGIRQRALMHSSKLWAVAVWNWPTVIGKFSILYFFVLYIIPTTGFWPRLRTASYW
jgi:hypothetical protein